MIYDMLKAIAFLLFIIGALALSESIEHMDISAEAVCEEQFACTQ